MRNDFKNRSIQDGIVVLMLGIALGIFSVYSFLHSPVKSEWILSPYLFPILLALFAVVLGYCLINEGRGQQKEAADSGVEVSAPAPVNMKKVAAVVAICIAYYALVAVVTFIPATIVFLFCLMWFMGERRWKWLIPLSVVTPLILYVIFAVGLSVRLP